MNRVVPYSGERCWTCKKTTNVVPGGGWICEECGAFNAMSFHNWQIPHEAPDIGPSYGEIRLIQVRQGCSKHDKHRLYLAIGVWCPCKSGVW